MMSRSPGIRLRLTAVTVACVTLAMMVGVGVLALVLHRSLQSALVDRTRTQAETLGAVVQSHGVDGLDLPSSKELAHEAKVQVVTLDGHVVRPRTEPPRLSMDRPAPGEVAISGTTRWPRINDNGGPVVATTEVTNDGHRYLVAVSRESVAQHEAVENVVRILATGLPLLMLATAAATWGLVGAALRPVEAIRRKTAQISTLEPKDRVPVPPTRDEVHDLAMTMNAMLDRLQDAAHARRRFVSDASHELRSPLATIRGATQLGDRLGSDEWFELLPLVATESERLERLVSDLLTLAKADDRGSIPLQLEDVDLDDLLAHEATRLRATGGVRVTTSPEPVRLEGDPGLLGQVLRNLGDNAARAAHSRVELTARQEGDRVICVVADDGPGIEPQDRDRVFDRFVRLDDARSRDSGGSGLGLPIVAGIIRAHGGSITIDRSVVLGGAAFIIDLPMKQKWKVT